MNRGEFENYISVDENIIVYNIPTPEYIVAEIEPKKLKKVVKSTSITMSVKLNCHPPPLTYSTAFECAKNFKLFLKPEVQMNMLCLGHESSLKSMTQETEKRQFKAYLPIYFKLYRNNK